MLADFPQKEKPCGLSVCELVQLKKSLKIESLHFEDWLFQLGVPLRLRAFAGN
jgi:hypothetical protein